MKDAKKTVSKEVKNILKEALKNAKDDRTIASSLIKDVSQFIGASQERHREVGLTAAKYLETLQKSNEQLVKIADLMSTYVDDEYGDLDDNDKEKLYEQIENAHRDKNKKIEIEALTEDVE